MIDLTSRLKLKKPDENERVDIDIINDNMDLLDETYSTLMRMEMVWQNASPTSKFAAQTINIDLSGYTHYQIVYSVGYNYQNAYYATGIIPIDKHAILTFGWGDSGDYGSIGHRAVTDITDSSITFGGACFKRLASSEYDKCAIPIKIYGIKGVQ